MPDQQRQPSPTVRRRRLASELRRLRNAAGMSASDVARRLDWGDSKPLYLESGQGVRPDPNDVKLLCELYGVAEDARDELVQLAIDGRGRGWWHPYRQMLSPTYSTYIGLEAEASSLGTFQPLMLPGLLQTDDYARAIMVGGPDELTRDEIDHRVEVRAKRQHILTSTDPARLWVVVDEAAIRRVIGGPDVMRAQLEQLLELSELANVTIQVVPFDAGAHPGIGGPFSILRFADAADAPAVYVDTVAGELFIEEEHEVERYTIAFQRLNAVALSIPATIGLIADAAAEL